jgi:osmotically-inducible protein OsmY
MKNPRLILAGTVLALTLPLLQGCLPAVATGVAVGVMSAHDRRTTGTQTDDETAEWKAAGRVPAQYKDVSHLNFTGYNKRLLITGEAPSEEAKAAIGEQVAKTDGVQSIFNEITIGPASSLASRSKDAYITSKVKARLVDNNQVSANHIKVVTEAGISYLLGLVTDREAKAAVQVARTTEGVRKVVNLLEVLPDAEIKRIDTALAGGRPVSQPPAPVENR